MTGHDWSSPDLVLPPGTRLLHIGPHKTGTTALQDAFVAARKQLPAHGVVFPIRTRQPMRAALAITGKAGLKGEPPAQLEHWDRLVQRVRNAGDNRVLVSTEFLADATDEQAAKVVEDLRGASGKAGLHLVVTLRPLSKILPSQWQQFIQNGVTTPYEKFLHGMLEPPYNKPSPSFWKRHDHPKLISQWARLVGHENVTVIVVDDSDRTMVLRVFESLLGLPTGLLVPPEGIANRSLTLGEVELVRLLNLEFRKRKWPDSYYARYLRYGGVLQVRTQHNPLPSEPRIVTPAWAQKRAAEMGAEFAEKIRAMGVRVVGDLELLGRPPRDLTDDEAMPDAMLSAAAAAEAVVGTIVASVEEPPRRLRFEQASGTAAAAAAAKDSRKAGTVGRRRPRVKDRPVGDVSTKTLVRVVLKRVRAKLSRRSRPL